VTRDCRTELNGTVLLLIILYYLSLIAFCRIPFQTIPVLILEWLHSAGINGARNGNFGRQNFNSAGICGAG
jgi:hypothetical protein